MNACVTSAAPGADAPSATAGSGFGECHRWRKYLQAASAVYSELERERAAGWQSEALDWWYRQRQDGTTATPATSFGNSDIVRLCERYCEHAGRVLLRAAPEFFTPSSPARRDPPLEKAVEAEEWSSPTFLDLGSAPGGVSKFLVSELHWRGVGVSLPVSHGGIASDVSWLQSPAAAARYEFIEGSITENDWHESIRGRTFDFVNGGAVQDHGQRSAERRSHDTEADRNRAEVIVSGEVQPVLPWFSFLVPQLRFAVEHVEEGGAIMLVFGVPQCASLSILLEKLHPLVHGGIHILETMHLTKSPVYVLLCGVHVRRDAETRAAWDSVLALLTQGSKDFWLGETEEGLQLAKTGFARHQKGLEAVWGKAASFLRRRRLQAERAMEVSMNGKRRVKRQRDGAA
ncbi:methyltransferase [Trypanosoma rangeli]|uniref:Methyltransferase n=1 Tax=Trypanosoma rangeli TaxID=5698 RepID=A0A422N0J7_TRYRA|nr:methyltransferase [Trypanosoma rangeli]RNE98983.1 methyltransferase [Trypanosoma rangeli]|eukprot:RNE98983.1 methyltransferase [Trypanosoma rangeli]